MDYICNYHMHTCFCDGKDTVEDMARSAFAKGLTSIGFSGHAYSFFSSEYSMTEECEKIYRDRVNALKEEYRGRMEVFLGLEVEGQDERDLSDFSPDYVIGGVHYLLKDGEYLSVDGSNREFSHLIKRYADPYEAVKDYYRTVTETQLKRRPDIIAHLDLVTKFNQGARYFDESDRRYLDSAFEAIDALAGPDRIFEINSGAAARGYKGRYYPSLPLLKRIRSRGAHIVLSSDAHSSENIVFGFDVMREIALEAGFISRLMLTRKGWQELPL